MLANALDDDELYDALVEHLDVFISRRHIEEDADNGGCSALANAIAAHFDVTTHVGASSVC